MAPVFRLRGHFSGTKTMIKIHLLYSMSTFRGHTMISIEVKFVEDHCADAAEH